MTDILFLPVPSDVVVEINLICMNDALFEAVHPLLCEHFQCSTQVMNSACSYHWDTNNYSVFNLLTHVVEVSNIVRPCRDNPSNVWLSGSIRNKTTGLTLAEITYTV